MSKKPIQIALSEGQQLFVLFDDGSIAVFGQHILTKELVWSDIPPYKNSNIPEPEVE